MILVSSVFLVRLHTLPPAKGEEMTMTSRFRCQESTISGPELFTCAITI